MTINPPVKVIKITKGYKEFFDKVIMRRVEKIDWISKILPKEMGWFMRGEIKEKRFIEIINVFIKDYI